jgi:putative oxidoreductase
MSMTIPGKWHAMLPQFQGILRIVVAATYMTHGTAKLFAWPYAVTPDGSSVALMSQMGLAGVLETFGGALLLLGLFTRPVAFLLSGEMAVAYFQAHFPNSPWPWANNGELPYLFCFIWLFFSAAGAGGLSLDSMRDRRG